MIKVKEVEITLLESELEQICKIVEKAKKETVFTTEPMPDGDMSEDTFRELWFKRGIIPIISGNSKTRFIIDVRGNQESERYYLNVGNDSL